MCVITINLSNISTPQNTVVSSASGRYRNLTTGTAWVSFSLPQPLTNAYNINPTVIGEYELEVTITNNVGVASLTAKSNFSVATQCGSAPEPEPDNKCWEWVLIPTYAGINVRYINCAGAEEVLTYEVGKTKTFCGRAITTAELGGNGNFYGSLPFPLTQTDFVGLNGTLRRNPRECAPPKPCMEWEITPNYGVPGTGNNSNVTIEYIDCNDERQQMNIRVDRRSTFCARELVSVNLGGFDGQYYEYELNTGAQYFDGENAILTGIGGCTGAGAGNTPGGNVPIPIRP